MYYLVRDNSMNGDRINQGDVLVVEKTRKDIAPGDIALIETSSKKMIRRVINEGNKFTLIASNSSYDNIVCEKIEIIGVITRNIIISKR